jgi:hypothetical protein
MRWLARWVWLVATPSAFALAQTTVGDDFESGRLLTSSGGQWNQLQNSTPATNTAGLSTAAARRGSDGFRVVDGTNTGAASVEAELMFSPSPTVSGGDYYARFWVRTTPSASTDIVALSALSTNRPSPPSPNIAEPRIHFPSGVLSLGGADRTAYADDPLTGVNVADNQWHLVEMEVLSLGMTAGTRVLWVDGTRFPSPGTFDWTGATITTVAVGETWANQRAYVGTVDIDDFRSGRAALASTLAVLTDAGQAQVGACVTVEVELRTTDGALSTAPYAVDAQLSVTGVNGTFYLDNNCTMPSSSLNVPDGGQQVVGGFRPSSVGAATISALQRDFLSVSLPLQVVTATTGPDGGGADAGGADAGSSDGGNPAGIPDGGHPPDGGGSDAGPSDGGQTSGSPGDLGTGNAAAHFGVGCDCEGVGDGTLAVGALVSMRPRRRRQQN